MGSEASLFTRGEGDRNCPEHPSRTGRDMMLRSGQASAEWPSAVRHPPRVIQEEQSSFRAFLYDLRDEAGSLMCLTRGRNLWMLCHPGNTGSLLERLCSDNDDSEGGFTSAVGVLRSMSFRHKSQILFGVLDESKTLYLPYGWANAIITLSAEGEYLCSMWYLDLPNTAARIAASRKSAEAKGRCGKRRGGKPSFSA